MTGGIACTCYMRTAAQGSARGGALQHTDLAQIIWVEYTTYVLYF